MKRSNYSVELKRGFQENLILKSQITLFNFMDYVMRVGIKSSVLFFSLLLKMISININEGGDDDAGWR
jgi:hypothetical protein